MSTISQPKGVRGPYLIFADEMCMKMLTDGSTLSIPEIRKLNAKRWSLMTKDEKKPYFEAAEEDRKRYDFELNQYEKQYHH